MKTLRITCSIISGILLLLPPNAPAQGTIYVSNLGQASAGSLAVGSDSWRAASFRTGTNAVGYVLNSVQLGLVGASGNPAGFSVFIYTNIQPAVVVSPSGRFASLSGSSDPVTGGIYTFTAASPITLTPGTPYHVVVTSDTPVANGAYGWSFGSVITPNQSNGWGLGSGDRVSINGLPSTWVSSGNFLQVAINATAIPEPSALALAGVGALLFAARHRRGQL